MTNCINPECTWRYEADADHCPMCGEPSPSADGRIRAWNSTLKVDPNRRMKQRSFRTGGRKNGRLAEAMRERARHHIRTHQGGAQCENCGIKIIDMKFDNISHDLTRGAHPDKALDPENMTVLCCDIDLMLRSSEHGNTSCHTLWERNEIEKYNRRKGKYNV